MNIVMGEKLLWILVIGKPAWWKQAIKKNISQVQERDIESPPKVATSSPIFKLLIAAMPIICERLNWIPGNGHVE
jgi:hypothetical protein